MKTYTLYFEFFGRKMKTTVAAESCQDAKEIVIGRVNFMSIYEDAEREAQSAEHEDPAVKKIFDLFKGFKK
jgi:uncharacterized protein YcaQ